MKGHQQHTLKDIAAIRSGHTFRRMDDGEDGNYRVLRISDLREAPDRASPMVHWAGKKTPPLLEVDDLVIPGRGERFDTVWFTSTRIAETAAGAHGVIPTNQVYTIRLSQTVKQHVLPGYLNWHLNRESTRDYFQANLRGTSIPILPREILGNLAVPVPTLHIQEQIVALEAAWRKEQQLMEQLQDNRRQMLDGIYQHYLNESHRSNKS